MNRRMFLTRGLPLGFGVGTSLLVACTATQPLAPAQPTAPQTEATASTAPVAATTVPATTKPAAGAVAKLPTYALPPMPTPELQGSGNGSSTLAI